MKDIDFDELDRAVSSLMNDVPKSEPVKDDSVKTLTLNTEDQSDGVTEPVQPVVASSEVDDKPVSGSDAAAPPHRTEPAPSQAPATPAARRGRFMDMVRQPAREVRKPMPSTSISRHGATLQPVTPQRPAVVGNPVRSDIAPRNEVPSAPEEPIVSAQSTNESVSREVSEPSTPSVTSEPSFTPPAGEQSPLVSPFLPDAKVEKRPLGRPVDTSVSSSFSASSSEISMAPASNASDEISSDPDAQLPEQPLPAELDSKLLNIETSAADTPAESLNTPAEPVQLAPRPASSSATKPLAATSIPQQYKVQPKVADAGSTGTIYDTASYHQPLAHPPKKKPGWLWVVAIILILLLGAAGGAVAYYLGFV